MYTAQVCQEVPIQIESAADICLKKIYRIKDRAEGLRELSNKLSPFRLDLPSSPNCKTSECQRALPPYFNEVDTILDAIERVLIDMYQIVDSVDI